MTTPARSRMPLTDTSNQPGRCRGPISGCSAANDGGPASAGKSPTPRRVAPGRPEGRLLDLALLLILRRRETGDMRTMVKEHARHNGPSHDGRASLRPPVGGNRARSGQECACAAAIAGHGSGHQSRSSNPRLACARWRRRSTRGTCQVHPGYIAGRWRSPAWMADRARAGPASNAVRLLLAVGRVAVGELDMSGLSWTPWDMIQNLGRADQAHSAITDVTRTAGRFHARRNGESAGQCP